MAGSGLVRLAIRRWLASAVVLALGVPLVAAMSQPPDAAAGNRAPETLKPVSVPGSPVPRVPRKSETAQPQRVLAEPVWPAAGSFLVEVPSSRRGPDGYAWDAGGLPVRLSAPAATGEVSAVDVPSPVRVDVLSRAKARQAGVDGLVFQIARADGRSGTGRIAIEVDYSGFAGAYGADWSSRLYLTRLPDCALTDPDEPRCATRTALESDNDPVAGTVSAELTLGGSAEADDSTGAVLALTAEANGPAGDFQATSLSPSATWQGGAPSGDFTWSYPLRIPPAVGGPAPELAISYSSGSVDGRTSSTSAQTSWVGEGFDLWTGFIERSYKSCDDDGHDGKGDLCWAYANATLSMPGAAAELVRDDATGVWRPKVDNGWQVQLRTGAVNGDNNGEYWVVTANDGTQYWFGVNRRPGWSSGQAETNSVLRAPVFGDDSGEPCHGSTFSDSWCQQAYRWNLDYVVDPHGNAMSVFYAPDVNYYGRNGVSTAETSYHRGARLTRIEYGQRAETLFTAAAPARMEFTVAERCLPDAGFTCDPAEFNEDNAQHWPDTPADLVCSSSGGCEVFSPTFWTRHRLTGITTKIWTGSNYSSVDSWTLAHEFPESGTGMDPALWLKSIQHTGLGGTPAVTLPKVTFISVQLPSRVEGYAGLPPLNRRRVAAIESETGGDLSVDYAPVQCTTSNLPAPDSNQMRCFPQKWAPAGLGEQDDWFHKHVVSRVVGIDMVAGSDWMETRYEYLGGGAWHFDDDDGLTPESEKTWSQWRGFGRVRVTGGGGTDVQTLTEQRFFRGMHGDHTAAGGSRSVTVTDSEGNSFTDRDEYAGMPLETITYNGVGGPIVTAAVSEPWSSDPTATRTRSWGTTTARFVGVGATRTRTALESGGWRRTRTSTTFETSHGLPVAVDDQGDVSTTADDLCTRTTYAAVNTAAHLVGYVARTETVSAGCAATPSRPGDVVSDVRSFYDGGGYAQAPVKGDATKTERATSYSAGLPVYQTVSTSGYDSHGRVTSATDALGNTATTAYTPAVGGPLVRSVVTTSDPDGAGPLTAHSTTANLDPAWGVPTSTVDPNEKTTSFEYDALGRVTAVWRPDRSKDGGDVPSYKYEYAVSGSAPTVVTTKTLQNDFSYQATYAIFDGFLRPRQTQAPSPVGGRVVTDTYHDSLGRPVKANQPYWKSEPPSGELRGASDASVPGQTVTVYDGAGRPVASVFRVDGVERWRSTTRYGGDRVHTDPPAGGTPTTVVSDARGRTTALTQWESGSAGVGTARTTSYGYDHADRLERVTDPAGNKWSYSYDLRGRQTSSTDPDRGTTTSTYDDLDRLATITDARGHTLAHVYDTLGRRTELHEGSVSGPLRAKWEWDLGLNRKGVLARTTRYVGADKYTATTNNVDALYRPTRQTWTIPTSVNGLSGSYQYTYSYNLDGTLATQTSPAAGGLPAETLVYGYNSLSMPTTLTGATPYVTGTLYSKIGQVERIDLHTGATNKKTWINYEWEHGTSRLARQLITRESVTGPDADTRYTYDPAGNITKIADTPGYGRPDDMQCFTYDPLRRLTQAWTTTTGDCTTAPTTDTIGGPAPYWTSYTHDQLGNRTSQTHHGLPGAPDTVETYDYPAAGQPHPHAPVVITTAQSGQPSSIDAYAYDEAGNTTTRDLAGAAEQTLTYDPEGHLATVTQGTSTTSFLYDADGARLLRKDPTGTTLYLPGTEIRHTTGGATTATRYYTHNGATIAARTTTNVTFLVADHHGTAQHAITATTGTLTQRRHDPYGNPRGATPTWPTPQGFLGGTNDDPTGLTHLGAREYDPTTGRFTTVDPIMDLTDPMQMHGYAYANNNPVTLSDPNGKDPCPYGGGGCYYDGTDSYLRFRDPAIPQCTRGAGFKTCERSAEADAAAKKTALSWTLAAGQAGIGPAKKHCWQVSCSDLRHALDTGEMSRGEVLAKIACASIPEGPSVARAECLANHGDARYTPVAIASNIDYNILPILCLQFGFVAGPLTGSAGGCLIGDKGQVGLVRMDAPVFRLDEGGGGGGGTTPKPDGTGKESWPNKLKKLRGLVGVDLTVNPGVVFGADEIQDLYGHCTAAYEGTVGADGVVVGGAYYHDADFDIVVAKAGVGTWYAKGSRVCFGPVGQMTGFRRY